MKSLRSGGGEGARGARAGQGRRAAAGPEGRDAPEGQPAPGRHARPRERDSSPVGARERRRSPGRAPPAKPSPPATDDRGRACPPALARRLFRPSFRPPRRSCSARCPASPGPGPPRCLLLLLLLPCLHPPAAALKPALAPIVQDRPFLVAWNAPSTRCLSAYDVPLDLDAFGILVNRQEAFAGGNITIFYYDQLGLYAYYQNGSVPPTAVNGSCPQNASLQDHLGKMVKDILRTMPSESFAGLAVIDWENWRPLWIRNWDKKNIYRSMSAQLVRRGNPGWTDEQVHSRAKREFEKAAINFMSETLKLAWSLRPGGWWGYYLFPDCYNYHYWDDFGGYTGHCPALEVQRNNKLLWLWEQSKALYPSIYMEEVLCDSPQGKRFVAAKLSEALRVAELPSARHSLPVFVYARPFYTYTLKELSQVGTRGSGPGSSPVVCLARRGRRGEGRQWGTLRVATSLGAEVGRGRERAPGEGAPLGAPVSPRLSQADLVHTIGQAAAAGAHGIVLWGDAEYSRNRVRAAPPGLAPRCRGEAAGAAGSGQRARGRTNCQKIRDYLLGALGPYIVDVTLAARLCSQRVRHG
ncbi:LOW QUALITY PROTEIN: hyaluronidase-4-like, partial [Struthio camelus]|uniref:LOW QUALITY PROTEIN: hyaluronidase-4-like n=1 Tax=Struthio camelus TaxID=8801 RepID=UPI003603E24F